MIVFLNYLPTFVLVAGLALTLYLYLKDKREAMLVSGIATALLLVVLKAVTPSYMPKGTVPPVPLVMPEVKELPPVEDRTRQSEMSREEREKHFNKTFEAVMPK